MKIEMTIEQAIALVVDVVAHRKRWGKYANAPYTQSQLYDALVLLHDAGLIAKDATPAEEVTKLRRQLAACQNREKARKGKAPDKDDETEEAVIQGE